MGVAVVIDGQPMSEAEATVSVFDRGFLYGDSVFEVTRTYGGAPFEERAHLERLARSCARVGIPMPTTVDVLAGEIRRAVEMADNPESYVRVVITRGGGPVTYDPSSARDPVRIVMALPVNEPPPSTYEQGIAVATVGAALPAQASPAAGAKASNYLANLLAVQQARERGAQEAVLLSPDGAVLEGASSNVFVVRGGGIRTPGTAAGILEGITRRRVLAIARREAVPVREGVFFVQDLYRADEVFITSSIREVVPVVRVDGVAVGEGRPGPIARRMLEVYRQATGPSRVRPPV
ncbi:MAG: aminotransferase class IV [Myxococcota bacterium]